MKKEKQLLGNMGLYMIGNFGSKVLIMLIVPIYTYYVTPEEIGYYDLITTVINLICPIIMLSIQEGAYRWLLHSSVDTAEIIKNSLLILGIGFLISLVVLGIISYTKYVHVKYIYIVVFIYLLQSVYTLFQEITRGLHHIKLFSISGIVYSLVFFITTVLFICVWRQRLKGLFLALMISLLCTCIFLIVSQKEIYLVFRRNNLKFKLYSDMIKYSIHLIPNNISWWITSYSDRFMVIMFLGMGANGIYAIATKFPTMLSMITGIFYSAWQEQAIMYYEDEQRDEYYTKIFNIYSSLVLSLTLLLIPATKIFIKVTMTAEYHSAAIFTGFLYLGSAFQAFSAFYGTGYLSACKTKGAMYTTVIGAGVNILINLLFMKTFGLQIAGISTCVSYMLVWVIRIFHTRKYLNIKLQKKRLLFIFVLNLLCIIFTYNSSTIIDFIIFTNSFVIVLVYNKSLIIAGIKFIKSKGKNATYET